ncbi:MAG: multicopper oxidase family protein [Vicinamibacterales bacterium]
MSIDRRSFLRAGRAPLALAAGWQLFRAIPLVARSPDLEVRLVAAAADIDVGASTAWRTWAYNGQVPGPEIRVTEGQRLRVTLENRLPEPTTIHWHGLPVPPDMDGVPDVSQGAVPPGGTFAYEFDVPASGTFFYHSHVGLQLDRGLLGPFIVTPRDGAAGDREHVLVFDDWLKNAPQPDGSGGSMMGGGGPTYDGYLLNGRAGTAAAAVTIERGERLRLRFINASAATTFRVGITGHRLRVTHADGQPIAPIEADTIVLGMGERYDATVTGADPAAWQIVAGPVDSVVPGVVAPFLYPGYQPLRVAPSVWPAALRTGHTLTYEDIQPEGGLLALPSPTRSLPLVLSGSMGMMAAEAWMINGERYPNASPLLVREGEWIRLEMQNRSMVRHPMHLHGHFFRLVNGRGRSSLKDTVLVEPMGRQDVIFQADHPGRWMFHCHNAYHMEAGMARVVEYL